MPIKYIGRTTSFSGKTLWEILGNLKNFGIGRLVKRNIFERYPEPCFIRILKVDTVPAVEGTDRKVRVYVERVFRGRRYPHVIEMFSTTYKTDYRLVPKSEEKSLWDRVAEVKLEDRIVSKTIPFPPLLSYILKEEMESKGEPVTEPRLTLNIKRGYNNFSKLEK